VVEGIACGCCDFAIRGDFSSGDGVDDAAKGGVSRLIFAKCILQDSSLEIPWGDGLHARDFINDCWGGVDYIPSCARARRMRHPERTF